MTRRLPRGLASTRHRRRHHARAYAIPVALAYAALAGLPPQIGVYGHMLGGIGYALLGLSRQLAVGPTSAISLMIGTVGALAAGDAVRYAQIASIHSGAARILSLAYVEGVSAARSFAARHGYPLDARQEFWGLAQPISR